MMVEPSKEDKKMLEILRPWLRFDGKKFVLAEGAPKEVEEMYKIYWQKYGKNFS